MKKYKLIREYPGSPELGTIRSVQNISIEEKYPELWEEVTYEIVLIKNSKDNFYTLFENEKLGVQETQINTIISVKRIEDGQIFNVGDFVRNINYSDYRGPIEYFVLDTKVNAIQVYYANGFDYLKDVSILSEKDIQIKDSLFNKSCLSLNDVFSIYSKFNNKNELTHHTKLLIDLVKNKNK